MSPFIRRHIPASSYPYIASHPLVFIVGCFAMLSGFTIMLLPGELYGTTSLELFLPPLWEQAWPAVHCLGGIALTAGILKLRPHWEAFGCVILTATFTCQCLAVFSIRGFETGYVAGMTLGSVAVGLAVRSCFLVWAGGKSK